MRATPTTYCRPTASLVDSPTVCVAKAVTIYEEVKREQEREPKTQRKIQDWHRLQQPGVEPRHDWERGIRNHYTVENGVLYFAHGGQRLLWVPRQ